MTLMSGSSWKPGHETDDKIGPWIDRSSSIKPIAASAPALGLKYSRENLGSIAVFRSCQNSVELNRSRYRLVVQIFSSSFFSHQLNFINKPFFRRLVTCYWLQTQLVTKQSLKWRCNECRASPQSERLYREVKASNFHRHHSQKTNRSANTLLSVSAVS